MHSSCTRARVHDWAIVHVSVIVHVSAIVHDSVIVHDGGIVHACTINESCDPMAPASWERLGGRPGIGIIGIDTDITRYHNKKEV